MLRQQLRGKMLVSYKHSHIKRQVKDATGFFHIVFTKHNSSVQAMRHFANCIIERSMFGEILYTSQN